MAHYISTPSALFHICPPVGWRVAESSGVVMFQASIPAPFSHCKDPPDPALCPTFSITLLLSSPYFGPIGEEDGDDGVMMMIIIINTHIS